MFERMKITPPFEVVHVAQCGINVISLETLLDRFGIDALVPLHVLSRPILHRLFVVWL